MTARRRFFGRLVAAAVASLGLSACEREKPQSAGYPAEKEDTAAGIDRQLLDAFVDTLVPKDQDPGAVEAGIPEQLLARFAEKPEQAEKAAAMLSTIERVAIKKYNESFRQLDLERREMVLRMIVRSRDSNDHPARDNIRHLRSKVVRDFYQSPVGWEMLGYTPPFPGGYPDYNRAPPG